MKADAVELALIFNLSESPSPFFVCLENRRVSNCWLGKHHHKKFPCAPIQFVHFCTCTKFLPAPSVTGNFNLCHKMQNKVTKAADYFGCCSGCWLFWGTTDKNRTNSQNSRVTANDEWNIVRPQKELYYCPGVLGNKCDRSMNTGEIRCGWN